MTLAYTAGSNPQYNGNISGITWKSHNFSDIKTYDFTYDVINRLDKAIYNNELTGGYSTSYTYDPNGNIKTLTRYAGTNNLIDDLTFTYKSTGQLSNQLNTVDDAGDDNIGFSDRGSKNRTLEYDYDDNGNMIIDKNKEINSNIQYNYLNLPSRIEFQQDQEKRINYLYDAAGIKLQKEANDITTDYIGNFVYENNNLKYILFSEGKITLPVT